jgi:hypothetical protein
MRTFHALLAAALLATTSLGCAGGDSFHISLQNDTDDLLKLALTKDGPPFEVAWAAPEDMVGRVPSNTSEAPGFVVVPPGRIGEANVKGKFDRDTRAILRVYRGELYVDEMAKIGPDSPDRLDLILKPGHNRFVVVRESDGRLALR